MHDAWELILFRDTENGFLSRLAQLRAACGADVSFQTKMDTQQKACQLRLQCVSDYTALIRDILETSEKRGFSGNLWQACLTGILVYNENAYSRACEIRGAVDGGINQAALHDVRILMEYFRYDFTDVEERLGVSLYSLIRDYVQTDDDRRLYSRRVRDRIQTLSGRLSAAETPEEFKADLDSFYHDFGCGKFGLHKAFRVIHREGETQCQIVPITNIAHIRLDDLVGYEIQKKKLRENTEAFLEGRQANNCLLFGDAGTGKSSSIRAILNEYYDRGLRIIEVYRHQFKDLVDIIAQIKNRNYRFIIYMDDLSFEENETDYKYLKAVIEGGMEKRPDNVLIYATSNRRHLVRETYGDKEGDIRQDMHTSDTVQEKLSLSLRFGVTIYFGAPVKTEYDGIVLGLALRAGIDMPQDELLRKAGSWELSHGGRSGRCAQQFIDYLLSGNRFSEV